MSETNKLDRCLERLAGEISAHRLQIQPDRLDRTEEESAQRKREDREQKRRNPSTLIGRSAENRGVGTQLADNRRRSGTTALPRLIVKRAASQNPNSKQMVAIARLDQPFQ